MELVLAWLTIGYIMQQERLAIDRRSLQSENREFEHASKFSLRDSQINYTIYTKSNNMQARILSTKSVDSFKRYHET